MSLKNEFTHIGYAVNPLMLHYVEMGTLVKK